MATMPTTSDIAKALGNALRNGRAVIHLRTSDTEVTRDVVDVLIKGLVVEVDGKQELIPMESIYSIQEVNEPGFREGKPTLGRVLYRRQSP